MTISRDDKPALEATPATAGGGDISTDGPHKIGDARRWLARQLLDSKLSDNEAFVVVAFHPRIKPAPSGERAGLINRARAQSAISEASKLLRDAVMKRAILPRDALFAELREAAQLLDGAAPTAPSLETDEAAFEALWQEDYRAWISTPMPKGAAKNHAQLSHEEQLLVELASAFRAGFLAGRRSRPSPDEMAAETFRVHTVAVSDYLNELYAVMVDPCAEGTLTVAEVKHALLEAAVKHRNSAYEMAAEVGRLRAALEQKEVELEIMLNMSKVWQKFCDPHSPFDTLGLLSENAQLRYQLDKLAAKALSSEGPGT